MKKTVISTINLAILFFATTIFANGAVMTKPVANSGFYAGIKGGYAILSSINKDETVLIPPTVIKIYAPINGNFAWGMYLGYQYAFISNLLAGLEWGYNDNGHSRIKAYIDTDKVTNHVESIDANLLAVGRYVWDNGFNIFAKGGVARVEQSDHITDGRADPAVLITKYVPVVNAGIGYQFLNRWNASVEYRHLFGQNQHNFAKTYKNQGANFRGVATINAVYLAITYLF